MPEFAHLHLHTQYSLLDGAIRTKELFHRVKEYGMDAVAMTDHGNMFGAVDFYKSAKAAGVKPIIGSEVYVARGHRTDKTLRGSHHLVLLARDQEGYRNLMYLVSMGFMEGFYYNPRVDKELLRKHSKGLFALSACLGGAPNQTLRREGREAAKQAILEYRDIFEPGAYFVEIQDNKLAEQEEFNKVAIELARECSVPLVATNDCHYLERKDAKAHDVLMAIQMGKTLDEQRLTHSTSELYVKNPAEMWKGFAHCPEAVENAAKIAAACQVDIDLSHTYLPIYKVPSGYTLESYLEEQAKEGLKRRFKEMDAARRPYDTAVYQQRLETELGIIQSMGFAGYFLIVWDFIKHAKEKGIPVGPGRGSGAGSLVAYALRITDLDPLPYGLLFERFLNPERVSMPDFDIDFCMNRRDEVVEYVRQKYGEHNVGQIITFGVLKAKSVIRDVGRVFGMPYSEVDRIAKLVPEKLNITLKEAIEGEPRLQEMMANEPKVRELMDVAFALEGLYRHAGMHAAGVVISEKPLWEYVPLYRGANGELVTQFAKDEVEQAGLVKFDFLGLKTLTVIETAQKLVNETLKSRNNPNKFDVNAIPLEDEDVYKLIADADTTGVFQLESSGFKELLKRLKPDRFEDIIAAVALYRPGPLESGMVDDYIDRKHGRKPITYPHPACKRALETTYGVIVYQEQVMQISVDLCGFTMGGADSLRKAMGKKKPAEMAKMREKFVSGAVKHGGMAEDEATALFEQIEKFAGYAFNKCIIGRCSLLDAESGETTTVEELYRRPREFHVHAVGPDQKIRSRKVLDVIYNGKKPVFELRTAQGKSITATDNHRILTFTGWKELGQLKVGDRIAAPRHLKIDTRMSWPRHEIIALAGLLSEGNTCHPSTLYFYNNDLALAQDFAWAARQFDDTVTQTVVRASGGLQVVVNTGRDTRFQKGQVPWNAAPVEGNVALSPPPRSGMYQWAEALGLTWKKATEKEIPGVVFRLRDEDVALFLGRLWSGDGFIANATQAVPYYATSSLKLARGVQTLLLRLGILSGLHEKLFKYRSEERKGYTVHLFGEDARQRFLEKIAPHCVGRDEAIEHLRRYLAEKQGDSTKDTIPPEVRSLVDQERKRLGLTWTELERQSGVSMRDFSGKGSASRKGFQKEMIERLARFFSSKRLSEVVRSDIFWDEIVAIEPRGIQDTYDLTVEDDHNFVTEGLIVHNSHSAAYALLTFQTAYLKRHHPVEFMAAMMSCDKDNTDKVVKLIAEARSMGIPILPPDLNLSGQDFTVIGGKIRFGLGAIKGIGESALESIFEARKERPFTGLFDFAERVDSRKVNRKVVEALIKCGAFDFTGVDRARLLAATDTALERAQKLQKEKESGQGNLFSLFGGGPAKQQSAPKEEYPEIEPWSPKERLAAEKECLGFYITGHPLDRFSQELGRYTNATTANLEDIISRERGRFEVRLGGVVASIKEKPARSGGRNAFFFLEDLHGQVEVLCFARTYAEYEEILKSDEPILVTGSARVETVGDSTEVKIFMEKAVLLREVRQSRTSRVDIQIQAALATEERLRKLRDILSQHPGDCVTTLLLRIPEQRSVAEINLPVKVSASEDLLAGIERLFGEKVAVLS